MFYTEQVRPYLTLHSFLISRSVVACGTEGPYLSHSMSPIECHVQSPDAVGLG